MAKETASGVSEAELNAPDMDEGELDVEHYTLPDASGITDPYLKKVWAMAQDQLNSGVLD